MKDLLFIREYIGRNHEFSEYDRDVHQIEYMFLCGLPENGRLTIGKAPDEGQIGIAWLELTGLMRYRLYFPDLQVSGIGFIMETSIEDRLLRAVPNLNSDDHGLHASEGDNRFRC